jgi:23S rRNA pseudouridine1911/1915/1917 synthase
MNKQTIKSSISDRLDKFLTQELQVSRSQITNLIKNKSVLVNKKSITKCGYKLDIDDIVEVTFTKPKDEPIADIDFDVDIVCNDDEFLIINKPPFLVTHPAPSVKSPTLVDWLKHKKIKLSTISGELRYGIVHRLDKETSGAMVVAKTNDSHLHLSRQLETKTMGRFYLAIIDLPLKENIFIEQPIYRNKKNRLKMSVCENGKYAKSAFVKLSTSISGKYELIGVKLFTGRTHQIRAHLSYINRHILGDRLYGYIKNDIKRVFLHSYILYLEHPIKKVEQQFVVNIPHDMRDFLETNFNMKDLETKILHTDFSKLF